MGLMGASVVRVPEFRVPRSGIRDFEFRVLDIRRAAHKR